jgi:small-conductance mechanosensitive channel
MGRNLALIIALLSMTFAFLQAQEVDAQAEPEEVTTVDEVTSASPAAEAADEEKSTAEAETKKPDVVTAASFFSYKEGAELHLTERILISLGIILIQIILIWVIWKLFKRLSGKIEHAGKDKIQPLMIKKIKLLNVRQISEIFIFLLKLIKYIITIFLLYITIPIIFSFYPATRDFAPTLFGYILNPLKNIGLGMVHYIPNLITIIIIVIIMRYVLRALKYFSSQITKGRVVIPGFYADWAAPTYKILQVLLYAFTIAVIYPYLPGSDSRAFQGVSVLLGVVFSIGSSTAIGNLVAGLVITYMRPFKIGDRVNIKDVTGFVVEKNLMGVRLKTHKNEYVTFPNLTILGDKITNYNTSSDEDEEGLIIHAEVTFGYSTPWETIHEILINAALATDYVLKKPKPFVLQTALDDFYARYQINCYTKEVDKVPRIYTLLYENIQNGFMEKGLDLTSAHYEISIVKNGSEK